MVNIQIEFSDQILYNFSMKKIEAFVFDMDGVLLDTETICWKTWEIAADEYKLKNILDANTRCLGANRADTCSILKSIYGNDFPSEKFLARTSELFTQISLRDGISLMPHAKETLEYLSKKYTLALASSTRNSIVKRQLGDAGILHYFKAVATGDMVEHSKPDPEIYSLACKMLEIPPEKCAAVEDSPNGIKSAKSAGLFSIMVPDKIHPDKELLKKLDILCPDLAKIADIF